VARSKAFERFARSVERGVQSPSDLDALDLDALGELTDDDERGEAVTLAAERLDAGTDDPRLVDALATLGTPEALDALARVAARGPVISRARAARRLWTLKKDTDAVKHLRAAVADSDSQLVAEEALPALLEIGSDEALNVVVEMIADTAVPEVRTMAISALMVHLGVDAYERVPTGALWTLRLGLTSRFPSVRAGAVDDLRDLVKRARGGADAKKLGVVAQAGGFSAGMSEVLKASQDPSASFDDDTLAALEDGEHDWAVDLVIRSLERGEKRAEAALKTLGGERAKRALADAAAGRKDPA
jgi:hypothetical protein